MVILCNITYGFKLKKKKKKELLICLQLDIYEILIKIKKMIKIMDS